MPVTRDDVLNDRVRERLRSDPEEGPHLLDEAAFEATRRDMLNAFEAHDALWVFGYGSLIWNPTFKFVESRVATLHDHQRRFCLWARSGRGSPERPGLWLGLDVSPHHDCQGIAFRLDDRERDFETLMLWRREMVAGAYVPVLRSVRTPDGDALPALCLLANHKHPRYVGELDDAAVAGHIAHAEGSLGTCREYLFRLVEHLREEGVHDPELEDLSERVRRSRGGM